MSQELLLALLPVFGWAIVGVIIIAWRLIEARKERIYYQTKAARDTARAALLKARYGKRTTSPNGGFSSDHREAIMTDDEFTPTTEQVREVFILGWDEDGASIDFDRWLAEHEAALVSAIVMRVRQNCTPSSEAYAKGGDALVAAVADWIESPPEWVDAPWRTQPTAPEPQDMRDADMDGAVVHTHGSEDGAGLACNERVVGGRRIGACQPDPQPGEAGP